MERRSFSHRPGHGLELEAIDLAVQLEWAEAQGRTRDTDALNTRLAAVLDEFAIAAQRSQPATGLRVHAPRAGEAA
ncbi:MAG: hypothetical protein ACT4PW_00460 [Acidimicrobiia bacterium]